MITVREVHRILPFYRPVPLTDLPLLYHPEHLFPYASYGNTDLIPTPKSFRMVVAENEFLRITVAPELGGRIFSLIDKRIDKEILFSNPVVKPVRILPVWAFISGGIEFNFPIAHSPTSMAQVGCVWGLDENYGFIRVGEREARTGMEWEVELGLTPGSPVLRQRTRCRNRTSTGHPWMSWTIAAVRSTANTEFVHPPHRVLIHDSRLRESDWPGHGLNWDRNMNEMTALFWRPGSAPQFGVFHHELGYGLMHLADPGRLPGKKVWTYGHGRHRKWGQATTDGGGSYAEIESSPLLDQSEKPLFPAGAIIHFEEFWFPVHSRDAADRAAWPSATVPVWPEEWLGWRHSEWQSEWEQFRAGEGPLPDSTVLTGIDLEVPLRRELESGNRTAAEPLALWLAFHGRPLEALPLVAKGGPQEQRIAGLIAWKALHRLQEAVAHLERGPLGDPMAVVELDELYAALGWLGHRQRLLLGRLPACTEAPRGPLDCAQARLAERYADLALATERPADAIRLLLENQWQREHQRGVRSELWTRARTALGEADISIPEFLGEDNLAPFGAYWSA